MKTSSRTMMPYPALLLVAALPLIVQIQASPLVYPNRWSFQKTTPSTSEPTIIYHSHDLLNNSIVPSAESGKGKSRFRYEIAGAILGVAVVVALAAFIYFKKKRPYERTSSDFSVDDEVPTLTLKKGDASACTKSGGVAVT